MRYFHNSLRFVQLLRLNFVVSIVAFYLTGAEAALAQQPQAVSTIERVRVNCPNGGTCLDRDAVVFVHGIFGNAGTFRAGTFDWPEHMPAEFNGRPVDIYRIDYTTALRNWF
jgi:hypothetical protein